MSKRIDLTGQRFGRWTVISFSRCENNATMWNCICDCGTEREVNGKALRTGHTKSCGCGSIDSTKSRYKDLTGQKFGYWTVIKKMPNKKNRIYWLCRCDCGTEREVISTQLICGKSTSCGCKRIQSLSRIFTKHGMTHSRLYEIYTSMLKRCFNPNCKAFKKYGDVGITVCDEWLGENGFENFKNWALKNGYTDALTLDRYPNQNGNYEPNNCRWASVKQQANNRSSNVYITRNGVTHTMSEWCDILGLKYSLVNARKQRGWDEERLFDPPMR